MGRKKIELPTVRDLDEWTGEVGGYTFVYQIKETSGGGQRTFYPVRFWRKGEPLLNTGDVFYSLPTRKQVEEKFEPSIKSFIKVHIEKKY